MNIKRKILIGSRKSKLAKTQTFLVCKKLRSLGFENIDVKYSISSGDMLSYRKFKENGGKGLFTKELDELLINSSIDLAVHSAKDIPAFTDNRLKIAAFLPREDARDVLITKDFKIKTLSDLKGKVIFGSSSPRRINYLKSLLSVVKIKNLRGNVESRIKQVRENKIDATLLASAGLKRLKIKYGDVNFVTIPSKKILPAPGQGAIAVMCRKTDKQMINICKKINHFNTSLVMSAERAFIKEINGDCYTPLGALAKVKGNKIEINGILFSNDGSFFSEAKVVCNIEKSKKAGKICAKKILGILKND